MKPKVLILGSSGMLGHQVFYQLKNSLEFEVYDVVFRRKLHENSIVCDVTRTTTVAEIISYLKPDYIVNCIGVLIKDSNLNNANAILINSYLPHFLKTEADRIGCKIIHISTDCVFSGNSGRYSEMDFRDADDIYGRSKALGELIDENHLTIRTSIVGPELKNNGEGLFHWFLQQHGEVNGYTRSIWGGVTTLECAKAIHYILKNSFVGLLHLTNGIGISKFEMLKLFSEHMNKYDVNINSVEGKVVDKSLISLREDFHYEVPSYSIMFEEMARTMELRKWLYRHYTL